VALAQVASTVHGKTRVGYTGAFLAVIQGKKAPKGLKGGRRGGKKCK
jgi:hypothetical protein